MTVIGVSPRRDSHNYILGYSMAACPQMFPLTARYVELLIILLMLHKPAPCMSKCGSRVTFRTVEQTCRLGGSLVHVQMYSNQAAPT
jgi:hypothetical protein